MKQNPITLEGTLTKDPHFLFLRNGRQGVGFTLQLENRKQRFIDVEINGNILHRQKKNLLKNSQVFLMGNMLQKSWIDDKGFFNSKFIVSCNHLEIK